MVKENNKKQTYETVGHACFTYKQEITYKNTDLFRLLQYLILSKYTNHNQSRDSIVASPLFHDCFDLNL